jgi:phosphatidyl-myo-inositol alpha-mannosyltransferase
MRIALVSPYSWTLPGGVTRHIEELAGELILQGHEVRVLSPVDPDDRKTRALHRRGAERVSLPDYLIPLGRTVGLRANGSVSNLSVFPEGLTTMRRELRAGRFDVVHVHEPIAPAVGWDACNFEGAPVVGTFHAYSTKWFPNAMANLWGARRMFNKLHARIAVSDAARWTGERYFGGRYEVIPNGVDTQAAPAGPKPPSDRFRILFVGRDDERKGLPILLSAFAGLREHVPVQLQLVGASTEAVEPFVADLNGGTHDVEFLGSVDKDSLWEQLHAADVLCAPSLGGESFGMVLIEAFAAGTPVVASDIAGYRQVVRHGREGLLVPAGDPLELAEALRSLALEPAGRAAMGAQARARAAEFAWPRVAASVTDVYARAVDAPAPRTAPERTAVSLGLRPADLSERRPARRMKPLEQPHVRRPAGKLRIAAFARRFGVLFSLLGGILLALLAMKHVDGDRVVSTLLRSSPIWVLVALGLFSLSMVLRAVSWHAIIKAALPGRRIKRRLILRGTLIGVLMSATLPARLGEPSRALIVARRLGRMRETLPVLVGTLVSQTFLNVLALAVLGFIVASSSDLFRGHEVALAFVGGVPVALIAAVLVGPWALGASRVSSRSATGRLIRAARAALLRLRRGLTIFREPRLATWAVSSQLAAWGLQLLGAYALLLALNLDARTDFATAAAVLFAVNVTAILPVTPSNIGVFQFAVVTVLSGVYGVPAAAALGYGIILQAVELATAVAFGLPALIGEGLSWRDVRMRAIAAAPVELSPRESPLRVR